MLHVVLLGFIKYFWRDAVSKQDDKKKKLLIARLSSIDVSGLGVSPLSGNTLVKYAGSLTGKDFRILSQVAPFVLYDLISQPSYDTWVSISNLIPIVWQPIIPDIDTYIVSTFKFNIL